MRHVANKRTSRQTQATATAVIEHSLSWRSTHRKNMCSRRTSQPVRSARERTCNTPHIDTPFMLRERTCNTRHTDTPLMLRERTCNTQHTDTPLMLRWPVDAIRPIVARGTPKVNRDYRRTISRAALGRPRLLTAAARTSSIDVHRCITTTRRHGVSSSD